MRELQVELSDDPAQRGADGLLVCELFRDGSQLLFHLAVPIGEFLHGGRGGVLSFDAGLELLDEVSVVAVGDVSSQVGLAQQLGGREPPGFRTQWGAGKETVCGTPQSCPLGFPVSNASIRHALPLPSHCRGGAR
ncbi:hypothetical protein ACIQVA_37295 [Streptomyces microflavus]|uniref:hypothetical protein n=1 Tax=Streptomyces microflavus TaxID=1919 RepID=UPI0038282F9C